MKVFSYLLAQNAGKIELIDRLDFKQTSTVPSL